VRFASYTEQAGPAALIAGSAAVVQDAKLYPLGDGLELLLLIRQGPDALRSAGQRALREASPVALSAVRLLPPLRPPSIRDFVAFEAHIEGVVQSLDGLERTPDVWYQQPGFYFTNPHALYGPHDDVPISPLCTTFDFECEIGIVIGVAGTDLTPEEAREHIIGYTIFNDWSARDLQRAERELGLGFSKGKDGANTLGPFLVTADEVEHRRDAAGFLDLTETIRLNGELIGTDSAASIAWTFDELVAHASRGTWVLPGDVLGSGTCGTGCLAEIWGRRGERVPPPLRHGDVVTLTVEGLGEIRNRVVAAPEPAWVAPRARVRQRGPRR
jgi:2-keto-4-pentenoate hydratase/2-oxohepta-3-ene-1,7-dioic acid hydratase in catechol pathway